LVLQEKDNYISNLNRELNELRIENEQLKDKLIFLEMETLGHSQGVRSQFNKKGHASLSNNSRTMADTKSNTQAFTQHGFGQTGNYQPFLSMERS
jgi:hypothetical protein